MLLTVILILGLLAVIGMTFYWVDKTNCLRVRLRAWRMELEIERNDQPKPKRRRS